MIKSKDKIELPSSAELPESDGLPVDNELHILVPNFLGFILGFIWAERFDWFWGTNMGIYYSRSVHPRVPIVPDGFLSLGVERIRENRLRRSYVVWEENDIAPIFALEIVSLTPGGEYDEKMRRYSQLGSLYYLIYNPDFWQRDRREPFEMYRLVNGTYQRQIGEPFWMPEIGLGIGRSIGFHKGFQREWLYWFDERGNRYNSPEDTAILERQQRELAEQEANQLKSLLARYQNRFGELAENE
ncbi:Uma2 family endonuclease [Oscillatoria salina]|uniref:Uma2 family endonuclease n=1 Tax=Oscillatoria salina TaxID=331517 RepID=UPI0013BC93CD|nr:Uma2 family endonuclease [Oscillatoria salina]MBZ8180310.1 Uma2 family endonuclease [Oscillatoria salina IIICB1]NET90524.1 Uma2 family endonuclease [Kamptonema sp. SIO1D9]